MTAGPAQAAFPGRNGRIAYVHEEIIGPSDGGTLGPISYQLELVSVRPNGSGRRTLLRGGVDEPRGIPPIAPMGGSSRLFVATLRSTSCEAGGGGLRRLTRPRRGQADSSPCWSPDGRRLFFVRSFSRRSSSGSFSRRGAGPCLPSRQEPQDPLVQGRDRPSRVLGSRGARLLLVAPLGSHRFSATADLHDAVRWLAQKACRRRRRAGLVAEGALDRVPAGL